MVSPRGGGKQAAPPPCPPSKHRPRLWRSCACPGDPSPRPVRFPRGLPLAGCLGAAWGLWWAWPAKGRGSHSETPCCPHQGSGWRVWGPRDPRLERGEEPDPAVGLGGPGAWWGGLLWPSAPLSGLVFPQLLQAPGSDPKPLCFLVLPGGARGSWAGLRATRWPAQALGRGVGIRPLPEPVTGCRLPVVGPGRSWQEAAVPSPPCPLVTGPCCGREPGSALWPCRSPKFKSASLCLLPSPEAWR